VASDGGEHERVENDDGEEDVGERRRKVAGSTAGAAAANKCDAREDVRRSAASLRLVVERDIATSGGGDTRVV
jgi:hypothetical protein